MTVPSIELRPGYRISRVIRGGWQLAGGHGAVDRDEAVEDLAAFCEAGIVTFDCADIYTGVEDLIGTFRERHARRHGEAALAGVKVHTKLVPDLDLLPTLKRHHVRAIVEQSLRRLRMDRLDLVQFHWWDYAAPGYLEALGWLDEMRREGKVEHIGGTNFDAAHTLEMIAAGFPLVSMQVQYSLLDDRPTHGLAGAALANGMRLFCYGSVAGGFLSDRWLGAAEPAGPFENRSLTKYKLIIDDFGGWGLFQELLAALRAIADRLGSDIATVASAAMLDAPAVAAVIVGARDRSHLAANVAIGAVRLDAADHAAIRAVTDRRAGPAGDTFALERDRTGRHGSIMRFNENAKVAS
ncbi:MAG TPA: aldo/keto reductase [Methylomirabilota bacterium]|nr:aldo/keto reductase [Methylomirabilota bacterium]